MTAHFRMAVLALAACATFAPAARAQASSAHYVLQQATLDAGGTNAASATHRVVTSLGQPGVIGTSSSPRFVLQAGFWSFAGVGMTPVVLAVTRNGADRTLPDLAWSGNSQFYSVYRSTSAGAIFDSSPLVSLPWQSWTDTAPPASRVVFYNVLAEAPGPAAP